MHDETRIYIVWGPTAEWGDGSGPLFYTDSLKSAGSYIREERRMTIDHAAQIDETFADADSEGVTRDYAAARLIVGWPDSQTSYWVECESIGTLWPRTGYGEPRPDNDDDIWEGLNS